MRIKQWLRGMLQNRKKKKNMKLQGQIILFKALQRHFHPWESIVNSLLQVLILRGTKWLPSSDALERQVDLLKAQAPRSQGGCYVLAEKEIPTSHLFLWR